MAGPLYISEVIDSLHPSVSGLSVITSDQIWILFDREIDENTVSNNFFITGPDTDTFIGPDLQLFQDLASISSEDEILQSPGFDGFVQGAYSFERVDLTTTTTVSTLDTVGSGHLYRTKAIFTPTNRLQANTEYKVHISGDEDATDNLKTGITERTVFDTVASGSNTSIGIPTFDGGYIGNTSDDHYHIAITTAGDIGGSKFTFYRDSDPLSIYGPFKTKRSGVLLSDGVSIEFTEGNYVSGDTWLVRVKTPITFSGNLVYPFKTGSGEILEIPTSTSTSIIGDVGSVSSSTTTTSDFSVESTTPKDLATNLITWPSDYTITIEFSNDIDSATVVSGVDISVLAEPVDGSLVEDSNGAALGELNVSPSVSGSTLSLLVGSGQLFQNNLITITLDSTIADTSGNTLSSDYVFSFTTQYYPLYCTVRKLRLSIGTYIQDIPDDTINFAIYLASLDADALTWNKCNLTDEYYKFARGEWVCCRAAEILLLNVVGGTGQLKSKKLGDLEVSYDTTGSNLAPALQRAVACQERWESVLKAGGQSVQSARGVVKGACDPDRPPIGRGWYHTRDIYNPQTPAANRRIKFGGTRRFRNLLDRNIWTTLWRNK